MRTELDTLAKRLRHARLEAGMTQVELAKAAKTAQNQISKIEGGEVTQPRNIDSIASALGVSPSWLQFGDGMEALDSLDAESLRAAIKFQSLTEDKRRVVKALLASLE